LVSCRWYARRPVKIPRRGSRVRERRYVFGMTRGMKDRDLAEAR